MHVRSPRTRQDRLSSIKIERPLVLQRPRIRVEPRAPCDLSHFSTDAKEDFFCSIFLARHKRQAEAVSSKYSLVVGQEVTENCPAGNEGLLPDAAILSLLCSKYRVQYEIQKYQQR